jgi:hypothetical protein
LGLTSEIVIQKLLFMDLTGKSINHLVRRISLSPRNGMDILSAGGGPKLPSAVFVDPRVVVTARAEEYTSVEVDFSRRVQVGALLFELHRDDYAKNAQRVAVYSGQRLIFFVNPAHPGGYQQQKGSRDFG